MQFWSKKTSDGAVDDKLQTDNLETQMDMITALSQEHGTSSVSKNAEQIRFWCDKALSNPAIANSDADLCTACFYRGLVEQNAESTFRWMVLASQYEESIAGYAQQQLSEMYQRGRGTIRNPRRAQDWAVEAKINLIDLVREENDPSLRMAPLLMLYTLETESLFSYPDAVTWYEAAESMDLPISNMVRFPRSNSISIDYMASACGLSTSQIVSLLRDSKYDNQTAFAHTDQPHIDGIAATIVSVRSCLPIPDTCSDDDYMHAISHEDDIRNDFIWNIKRNPEDDRVKAESRWKKRFGFMQQSGR